jgi:hypothetical protein
MPIEAPPAPAVGWASELFPPHRMQMMENDTAKLEETLIRRCNSWGYPMEWRIFMSSFLSASK